MTVLLLACVLCLTVVPSAMAASIKVLVDTPFAFRADFTGLDTDPTTLGGNDFEVFVFDYWTVLVNLRGDSVTGTQAAGFYEIQVTHTGSKLSDPTAPVVNTFLVYSGLEAGDTLVDTTVSSQPHDGGSDVLSTDVSITFDQLNGVTHFSGTIAADADTDANGTPDSEQQDMVIKKLLDLKSEGTLTGREMGQVIKQTRKPIK
jgi:hypothetical protein